MIGLVPLAAALAITAGQFDLTASASAETRAGEAPIATNSPPQASVMAIAIPGAQVAYLGPRLVLEATYHLRIFWRTAEDEPIAAPLYLHAVGLSLTSRNTRRLTTKLAATAYEGSADYTFLPVIYGTGQATLVTVPRLFSATMVGSAEYRATRLVTPAISVEAMHNQPIGQAEVVAGTMPNGMTTSTNLPHFTSATVIPGVGLRLSPVVMGSLNTIFMYEYVSGISRVTAAPTSSVTGTTTLSVAVVVPTVGTAVRLGPLSNLKLSLGAAFVHFVGEVPGNADAVTPHVTVAIDSRVFGHHETALDLIGAASIEYYVDPVLAIAAPRGGATASALLRFSVDWSIGLQGTFSSTLSAHPLPTTPDPSYPDEVTASVALPVRHPLSPYATLEFGARWADRSPFYSAPDFGFHQRQLWAYVLVTGTSRAAHTVESTPP